uniref:Uncharacterized protein n=1 Tax=uncultured prokaryote TaxID=198431 RepID=A0A0H5Q3Y9_9ZZZZ|nr:hypothetical protein [uncultured prokaryote]
MHVTLSVYTSRGRHEVSVVAHPKIAASLGEYVLLEGVVLEDLSENPSATECLASAYRAVGRELLARVDDLR